MKEQMQTAGLEAWKKTNTNIVSENECNVETGEHQDSRAKGGT